ncbi:TolC family outer membrane protein [Sphingosinicella sp. CPCC 101087]|uniref:TolC family outer membrane protein n=1 Tax=Sphingosinicella sp. CPCC 101087 TaxID=2497754 RepID=UPI0013EC7DA3|nr:TolC family outer membrane protein [Sphingosinicella sp. CPCC 101087]
MSITASGGLSAQEVAPAAAVATVDQAVDLAINTQPEVQARWEAFRASSADRRAARGGYLPSVDVNGEYGAATREYDDRGWFTRDYVELQISQMLFDGFLVRSQLEEADQNRLARYYELLDEVQNKALEAIEAYEDVRQFRETLALARENYATHQSVHALISERAESGVSNMADLEQAAGRLALAEANMLTEQANLHDVTARFQRIVGRPPAEALEDFAVASTSVPADLESVLNQAVRNHPSLYAANATIEAARAAVAESKAAYYPRVSVAARGGTYRNSSSFDAQFDPRGRGEEAFVGLNFSYNLFRGGADQARSEAAVRRLYQSEDLLQKACVDLRQNASIAWNNVVSLRARLEALDAHRMRSANVATAYEQQFYIGRRTLLDVLDAKNEAFQSERSYAQAQHELTKAYYRTLRAMGILLDVLGQSREGMPAISAFDDDAQPASIDCGGALASVR